MLRAYTMRYRMDVMRRLALTALAVFVTLLAGCGGEVRRIFPPKAGVQELHVQPDGRWALSVRLQNFSNVTMRLDRIEAKLRFGQIEAGILSIAPAIRVGPEAGDAIDVALAPSAAARDAVKAALDTKRSLRYRLDGRITACDDEERCKTTDFEYDSALSPVPGLSGVLR